METSLLPIELSNLILDKEIDIDTGNLSENLLSSTIQLYVVTVKLPRKQSHFIRHLLLTKRI